MRRERWNGITATLLACALGATGCMSGWDASDQVAINALEEVGRTEWSWPDDRDDSVGFRIARTF